MVAQFRVLGSRPWPFGENFFCQIRQKSWAVLCVHCTASEKVARLFNRGVSRFIRLFTSVCPVLQPAVLFRGIARRSDDDHLGLFRVLQDTKTYFYFLVGWTGTICSVVHSLVFCFALFYEIKKKSSVWQPFERTFVFHTLLLSGKPIFISRGKKVHEEEVWNAGMRLISQVLRCDVSSADVCEKPTTEIRTPVHLLRRISPPTTTTRGCYEKWEKNKGKECRVVNQLKCAMRCVVRNDVPCVAVGFLKCLHARDFFFCGFFMGMYGVPDYQQKQPVVREWMCGNEFFPRESALRE